MRVLGYLLLVVVSAPLVYVAVAFALMALPAHRDWRPAPQPVDAYLASNGVHVDFVFPVDSEVVDWLALFPLHHFPLFDGEPQYIAIGWGDREFYLTTPHWRDLRAGTALRALSGTNPSLLHVSYLRDIDQLFQVRRLAISAGEYASLAGFVRARLAAPETAAQPVAGFRYGPNDAFYPAAGSYSLWYTCNNWIGEGLRRAGIRTSVWTPFAANVFYDRTTITSH